MQINEKETKETKEISQFRLPFGPAGNLALGGVTAACYVVLTMVFSPISFGAVQFRVSEALCILPVFSVAAVPGLFVGCFLANLIAGAPMVDVIFGSLATLLGAWGTYQLRDKGYLASLPPIVSNMLIIPFVLRYAYGLPDWIPFMMVTVALGEALSVGIVGNLLMYSLKKYKILIQL